MRRTERKDVNTGLPARIGHEVAVSGLVDGPPFPAILLDVDPRRLIERLVTPDDHHVIAVLTCGPAFAPTCQLFERHGSRVDGTRPWLGFRYTPANSDTAKIRADVGGEGCESQGTSGGAPIGWRSGDCTPVRVGHAHALPRPQRERLAMPSRAALWRLRRGADTISFAPR